ADSQKVIQRWRSVKRAAIAEAEESSALSVPAYPGWLKVDIRPYGQGMPIVSSPRFAIGEVIALAGQSLAEKAISSTALGDYTSLRALGLSVGTAGAAFVAYASNTGVYPPIPDGPDVNFPPERWMIPGDSTIVNSSFAVELMLRLRSRLKVPIGLVGYAVGGTGISTWLPGSKHFRKLAEVISRAGGSFGTLLWIQGHYESKNGNTPQQYMKQLETLFSTYQRAFTGPNGGRFNRIVITIPAIGTYDGSPAAINMVRHTAKAYVRNTRDTLYVDGLDATLMPDMLHPSQAGNVVLADHVYRAVAYSLGLLPYGDEGPHIAFARYVTGTQVIRLRVRQINGARGLIAKGQLESQFLVYTSGSQLRLPLMPGGVTIVSPQEIDLHLESVPAEGGRLTVWYRESPDSPKTVSSGIYDTRVDSDGLTRGRQLWCDAVGIPVSSVHSTH
ncbi:MAG TPA: sialate O-acetylesterase, partial [Steroidobacteraceae bacterium]|nr:sialate O-acetylesterase [Steroidobacteraceae bacterium]